MLKDNLFCKSLLLGMFWMGQGVYASAETYDEATHAICSASSSDHVPFLEPNLEGFARVWYEQQSMVERSGMRAQCHRLQTQAREIVSLIHRSKSAGVLDLNGEYGLFSREFIQNGYRVYTFRGASGELCDVLSDMDRRLYGIRQGYYSSAHLVAGMFMRFIQEGALFETAFSYGWEIPASQEKSYFQKLSTHLAPAAKVYLYVPKNRMDSIASNASDHFKESGDDGLWNISIRGRDEQTQDILYLVSLEKKL